MQYTVKPLYYSIMNYDNKNLKLYCREICLIKLHKFKWFVMVFRNIVKLKFHCYNYYYNKNTWLSSVCCRLLANHSGPTVFPNSLEIECIQHT